jgi:hypothetical protein
MTSTFNVFNLRNVAVYNYDGSAVNSGYLFTASTGGYSRWTNSINLKDIQFSTLTGSTISVSSISSGTTVNNVLINYSTIQGSTITASTVTTQFLNYSSITGSSIFSQATTNNFLTNTSTITGSTITASTVTTQFLNYSSLVGSSIFSQATTNNFLTNTSTMTGSTITASTVTTQFLNYSSLVGSSIFSQATTNNFLTNTSTITGSTITTSTVTTQFLNYSSLVGSSIFSQATTNNFLTNTSTITGSTITASTVTTQFLNYSSLVGSSIFSQTTTNNFLTNTSTITGSTITATNAAITNLTSNLAVGGNNITGIGTLTVTGTGTAVSVPNGTVSASTITNTTLTTTNAAITNLTSNLNAATYNISGVGTLTANTIQKTTTGDLTIQQTGNSSILLIASGVNGIYTQVGTAGFQVVNVGNTVNYTTINSTDATFSVNVGLSSGKTLTLNGASAIQNSTASQTYRVLSTFKHSFEVVSGTEIAKIDSTGLTITSGKTLTTPSITYAGNITYNASASTSNTHSFQIADNSRVVVNNDGITANSSANNQPALRLWTYTTPSANTSNNGAYIGVGTGTNQCGIINFGYAGSGNPSNYLGFGLFGADDLLKVYPSSVSVGGNVGIGSTTPGGLLDVYYLSATPCSLFKVTNGLISMNMSGLDGTFISQSYDVVTIGKNYTGSSVSNSGRSASYIYLSSPVSASAEISFYISDTNGGIPGKIMTVNSSGINISATKIFTLNGNSSTSTLEMSNSTGVLKLQNNNNSNSYEVPTSQIHSFKVNAVEIANISSTGLNITNSGITLSGSGALLQNSNNTLTYRVPSTYKHSFEVVSGTELVKIDGDGLYSFNLRGVSGNPLRILSNTAQDINYIAPTGQKHSFQVNAVEIGKVDGTGLNISATKTITLNGNSSTSTLDMSNTTGVLTLKNNNNSNSYEVPTSQNHSFKVNAVEIGKVDGTGLNISATKTITLNGNSSTSTLDMSNTTGVLKLQNNNNSNSYEVPTGQIHSFKVNAVEIAKIDGTGLTSTNLKTTSASNQSTAQPLIYAGSNANNMVLCDNLHQTYNFMDILGYPGWTKIVNTPNFVKYTDGSIINFWGSGSCFNLAGVFTYTVAIYNSANTLQQSLSFTSCYFDNNTQSRKNTSWGGVFTSIPAGTYYLQMRTAAANNNSDGGDNAIMSWSITSS